MNTTRDFNYVDDLTNAFELSIKQNKAIGEIINIGSGFEISIKNLIFEISKLMNKHDSIKIVKDKKESGQKKV